MVCNSEARASDADQLLCTGQSSTSCVALVSAPSRHGEVSLPISSLTISWKSEVKSSPYPGPLKVDAPAFLLRL